MPDSTYCRINWSTKLACHPALELIVGALSWQVKSKTVAQCVEYYYTWKKIMRLGRRHRTRLAEIIDDCMVSAVLSGLLCPYLHSDVIGLRT